MISIILDRNQKVCDNKREANKAKTENTMFLWASDLTYTYVVPDELLVVAFVV